MKASDLLNVIYKFANNIAEKIIWIGIFTLVIMVLVISIDVIGRFFFNSPLVGSLEIIDLCMALLGGFAIMYTSVKRGHVAVDVLVEKFSERMQILVVRISSFIGFVLWGIVAWQIFSRAVSAFKTREPSEVLLIPLAPFYLTLAIGITLCSIVLLIHVFQPEKLKTELDEINEIVEENISGETE